MLASVPSASSSFFVRKVDFQVCRKSDEVLCTICGQELTCKCLLNVCPDHTHSDDDIYIMMKCMSVCLSVTKVIIFKWPPVGLLMMTIYMLPKLPRLSLSLPPSIARHSLPPLGNAINWKLIIIIMNVYSHDDWIWSVNIFFFRLVIEAVCLFFCHQIVISLRAERRRREVRREKFTHKNCTLPTIHLGPAGRRPAWA